MFTKLGEDAGEETEPTPTEEPIPTPTPELTPIPISTTDNFIGYYADFDPTDDKIDGVIYADLAIGGSGTWNNDSNSSYSYSATTGLKEYYVSQKDYAGSFGTKDVLSKVSGTTGKDRFYIMALENEKDSGNNEEFYFYYNAYNRDTETGTMTDYADTTKTGFGEGKTNTRNMVAKWDLADGEGGYGAQNARDMWGVIKDKVSGDSKWFVPSSAEWSAFANEVCVPLGLTTSNYGDFGLSHCYWLSSQNGAGGGWCVYFPNGTMTGVLVYYADYVRLSATF